MKTKRIDFDIDLAKKIQAGEAQGRIVTRDGQPARVICWDRKDERVLVRDNGSEWICTFYSHFDSEVGEHMCADGHYHEHCIPYEGNEHLVGTTGEPKEGGAE